VVGVIVLLVGVLEVVDDNTSGAEAIAPGTTIEVGEGVTFVPADGWSVIREGTTPGSRSKVAGQGGSFSVEVGEWEGAPAEKVERTRRGITADGKTQLTGDGASFHTDGGLTGSRRPSALAGPSVGSRPTTRCCPSRSCSAPAASSAASGATPCTPRSPRSVSGTS
jgi:hypothetical protein